MSQLDVHFSLFMVHIFLWIFCILHHLDGYGILGFLEHFAFVGTHLEFAELGHFLFW